MEAHILSIIRFSLYTLCAIGGVLIMIKADDRAALRRITAVCSAVMVWFNEPLGTGVYLLLGSTLEALIAGMGVIFVLILIAVIVLLPVILAAHYLIH